MSSPSTGQPNSPLPPHDRTNQLGVDLNPGAPDHSARENTARENTARENADRENAARENAARENGDPHRDDFLAFEQQGTDQRAGRPSIGQFEPEPPQASKRIAAEGDPTRDIKSTAGGTPDHGGRLITVPWHPDGSGPVPTANGPVTHRWRKVAGRTLSKAWSDSLFGMSSQAAFWTAMSTAPFLLALLGLSGIFTRWLFGPDTMTAIRNQASTFLNTIFNEEVADNLIGNTIDTILSNDQTGVISVGLVISLWAGSSAMSAFVEAITIAYGQHEVRHPVLERFFALGLYIAALMAEIVALPLLAIGPEELPKLFPDSWEPIVEVIMDNLYYPVLGVGLILLVATLYKVAPKRKHAWARGLPGAALAAAVFLVATTGLRIYLAYVYSHGLTYGALATPITFLLFYYFMSMAIIIGAQFNNALLEYYPPAARKKDLRATRTDQPAAPSIAA